MKIVIFGAGGQIAQRIAREALARNHEVVGVVRDAAGVRSDNERLAIIEGDATDATSVARIAKGVDVVINALSPRPSPSGRAGSSLVAAARALIAGAQLAGVKRLIVVGGAGSLEVAPGRRLMDSPGFPPEYKPEALEQAAALDVYKTAGGDLDWIYISPAAETGPGERTGHYRSDESSLLVDAKGRSTISFEDYAKAVVDEIEHPTHSRTRMSVAY
ncbi:MAG TPA: NAD(P)H-binding protein [Gemmatimonadaceae bacterium]